MLWIQGELGRKYVVGLYIACIERKVFVFALPLLGLSPIFMSLHSIITFPHTLIRG